MDALLQDLRQAWRSLTRSRALAMTAVLVMALGTGATTAVVSLLDELRLRPLALPRPHELYLAETDAAGDINNSFSWPEYRRPRRGRPARRRPAGVRKRERGGDGCAPRHVTRGASR